MKKLTKDARLAAMTRFKAEKSGEMGEVKRILTEAQNLGIATDEDFTNAIWGMSAIDYTEDVQELLKAPGVMPDSKAGKRKQTVFCSDLMGDPMAFFANVKLAFEKDEDGNPVLSTDQMEKLAKALGDSCFVMAKALWDDPNSTPSLFRRDVLLDDGPVDTQVVTYLPYSDKEKRDLVNMAIAKLCKAADCIITPSNMSQLMDLWWLYGESKTTLVKATTNAERQLYAPGSVLEVAVGEPDLAFDHSGHELDADCAFPVIGEFLDRTDAGAVIAAYFYGVWSGRYSGRAALWVYGKIGGEGKSVVLGAIGKEAFGNKGGLKSLTTASNKDKFSSAAVVRADMIVYPDCNNPNILNNEVVKQLTSGGADPMAIRQMYNVEYDVVPRSRLMVISNHRPRVYNTNSSLSRLIFVSVRPFAAGTRPIPPKEIEAAIHTEMPGFLAYGKAQFEALTNDGKNSDLELPEDVRENIQELIGSRKPLFADFLEEYVDICDPANQDVYTSRRAFKERCQYDKMSNHEIKEFLEYLEKDMNLEVRSRAIAGSKSTHMVIKGLKLKDLSDD